MNSYMYFKFSITLSFVIFQPRTQTTAKTIPMLILITSSNYSLIKFNIIIIISIAVSGGEDSVSVKSDANTDTMSVGSYQSETTSPAYALVLYSYQVTSPYPNHVPVPALGHTLYYVGIYIWWPRSVFLILSWI